MKVTRSYIYHLLTESEVITGKCQKFCPIWAENCIDWVTARLIHQGRDLRSPFNDRTDEVNKLFYYMAFSLWIWACDQLKPTTGQRITYKFFTSMRSWAGDTFIWYRSADTLFDSCQLTITWMSIGKLRMPWTPTIPDKSSWEDCTT